MAPAGMCKESHGRRQTTLAGNEASDVRSDYFFPRFPRFCVGILAVSLVNSVCMLSPKVWLSGLEKKHVEVSGIITIAFCSGWKKGYLRR